MTATPDIIEGIPLFAGLPAEDSRLLSDIAAVRNVARGEIIFSEGQSGHGFYVALTGRIKIYKLSAEGREQILHIFGPGEPFGEVPVFTGKHFPATAEALHDGRLLYFKRDAFVSLIEKRPSLALNMMAVLSHRLHVFTDLIEDLSLKEVPARLAAYLLYISEQQCRPDSVALDITKGQLAGVLGTIPETLSRILSKLAERGMIEQIDRHHIRMTDQASLEQLAEGRIRLS